MAVRAFEARGAVSSRPASAGAEFGFTLHGCQRLQRAVRREPSRSSSIRCRWCPTARASFWLGRRQFFEQFLNPLLFTALLKIPFNAWYRGSIEGIASEDLARALRSKHKTSWRIWSEVLLPIWLQKSAELRSGESRGRRATKAAAQCASIHAAQSQELDCAGCAIPLRRRATVWSSYEAENSYLPEEEKRKQAFVSDFIARLKPKHGLGFRLQQRALR